LLHDYAEGLRNYSDFVVYLACKSLWENDASPFYPKIKQISEVCELIDARFRSLLSIGKGEPMPTIKENYFRTPKENPDRRMFCDFLISKGKPDYFEQVRFWSNYDLRKEAIRKGREGSFWGEEAHQAS
jgi:hypothetical protein